LILKELVGKYGKKKWCLVSQKLYTMSGDKKNFRSSKLCRDHYNNQLDPSVRRGTWTKEEDLELLKLTRD